MKTMTYSESRARYAETLDAVANDAEPVTITRPGHEPVVIVAKRDYESLLETVYLLCHAANAQRLGTRPRERNRGRGRIKAQRDGWSGGRGIRTHEDAHAP